MSLKKEPTKVIRIPTRFEFEVKEYIKMLLLNPPDAPSVSLNPPDFEYANGKVVALHHAS